MSQHEKSADGLVRNGGWWFYPDDDSADGKPLKFKNYDVALAHAQAVRRRLSTTKCPHCNREIYDHRGRLLPPQTNDEETTSEETTLSQ